jgi:serine/threonine protein kinase
VQVLNFFRANGTVYLVMRFEVGHTLRDHIRKNRGRLKETYLRAMFSGLLDGLGEVHGCGLLHLDIKPANIWLRDDGSPVLLDFGAARYAVDIGPPEPRAMYTPGYAAPEQYHGKFTLGPWTDIYAVGACIYAALAGAAPQAADDRLVDDQLLPARQRWGLDYSPRLLATIDECLRIDPTRRPQHARALQASLNTDQPGDKRPDSWLSLLGLRRE